MAGTAVGMARGAWRTSKRLILSYIIDWILIIAIAALGVVFNRLEVSNKRTFVLQDPSLAYPYKDDTVTILVAGIVALVVPAAVMFFLCILVVPGAGAPRGTPQSLVWRRKLWEWNTAWMGLALSCATAFMITEGLKDLAGKPRPHMLARCQPNRAFISQYTVGGLGSTLNEPVPIMVDAAICTETDAKILRDAFASWPSGHSSFAFAGLLYFSFFLSAKFAVTLPYLNPISFRKQRQETVSFPSRKNPTRPLNGEYDGGPSGSTIAHMDPMALAPRNQAAAPPVYLLIIVFIPVGAAIFICVSRWFDYHHHAFDIICGALLGIFTSWFSFRYYHMPIRRGAGWSWGARSRDRAFWLGVGRESYVGDEGWESKRYDSQRQREDMELNDLEKGHNAIEGGGGAVVDNPHSRNFSGSNGNGRDMAGHKTNASIDTERQPLNQTQYDSGAGRLDAGEPAVGRAV